MTTYYVSKDDGDNGDSGLTPALAWLTINYAVSQVSAGDTIRVIKGATPYTEGFTTASDGTGGSQIYIVADDPDDPAIIGHTSDWDIDSDYWNIEDLILDGFTSNVVFGEGSSMIGGGVRRCHFRHGSGVAIQLWFCDGVTLEDLWVSDIRSRISGDDLTAISVKRATTNLTLRRCCFEDNGSDGFHVLPNGYYAAGNILVENCAFWINRPYGTTTRYWQDYSTNVGENGIDVKELDNSDERVDIDRCLVYGFRASVAGQDASGGEGPGIYIHRNVRYVTISRCMVHDCDRGINFASTTANQGGVIRNTIVYNCAEYGLFFRDNDVVGIVVDNCSIIDCGVYIRLNNTDIVARNNYIKGGDFSIGGAGANNADFDYTAWDSLASGPPAAWVGANDPGAITADLDNEFRPGSSSTLLNDGENRGLAYDRDFRIRDLTPSIGGCEQPAADGFLLNLSGDSMYNWSDAKSDTDHEIFLVPSPHEDGFWRYAVYIKDQTAHYLDFDLAASKTIRFAFYIEPSHLTMASGDMFQIIRLLDAATTVARVYLRYSVGNYYIAVSAQDDSVSENYIGTSSGFSLGDNDRHLIEVDLFCAANPGDDDGTIQLWFDGVSQGSETGLDNDTLETDTLRFGAPAGIDAGTGDDESFHAVFYMDSLRVNNTGGIIGERDFSWPALPDVFKSDAAVEGLWLLNEVSGDRADDSPNANTLTDINTVESSTDRIEGTRSADFEASSSEYLRITDGDQAGLDQTGSITVGVWIKIESEANNFASLMSRWDTGSDDRQYRLFDEDIGVNDSRATLQLSSNGTSTTIEAVGLTELELATWYHVVAVYDSTNIFIYVDGEIDYNWSVNPIAFAASLFDGDADFTLGTRSDPGLNYDGLMDEAFLMSRALTGAEVKSLFENLFQDDAGVAVKAYYYRRRRA